ncbi:hypothetical protein A2397_03605 [Candidatus Amesbacteria bacterium RIFOXYB1_FULL_44_23]|uniref:Uncharacterized protein n=1 Tax=Candidatus Amesbacteria bacterium RIFOXYB1_FULL_44_23 TaxID=1797263 RepID=A0A1F4ZP97_9BACT|nr:MAG: hypothetical protein A2397_03605 [Candidatus Amesbacteria bacterium RIFOXYB1_FULL_44_23]
MNKKYKIVFLILLFASLIVFVFYFLSTSKIKPVVLCKKAGESICINPGICPGNKEICCGGLYAVIGPKSYAVCEIPSELNMNKPRVPSLER